MKRCVYTVQILTLGPLIISRKKLWVKHNCRELTTQLLRMIMFSYKGLREIKDHLGISDMHIIEKMRTS